MFIPSVAQAAGLSFIAANRRPYELRLSTISPRPRRANTTVNNRR